MVMIKVSFELPDQRTALLITNMSVPSFQSFEITLTSQCSRPRRNSSVGLIRAVAELFPSSDYRDRQSVQTKTELSINLSYHISTDG